MKAKIILLLFFVCIVSSTYGQTDSLETEKQNHKYKWGCAVAINSVEAQIGKPEEVSWNYSSAFNTNASTKTDNSISLSLVPKYYINKNLILRFEFCITNFETAIHFDTKIVIPELTNYTINNATSEQRVFKYVPGIHMNYINRKRFESYCGLTLSYSKYDRITFNGKNETWNFASDTLVSTTITNGSTPGGFTTGIGALAGFNFYLQKHVSIGVEFSTAYLYYDLGGSTSGETTYQTDLHDPTITQFRYADSSYKGFQFSKILSSFNFGFWF